MQNLDTARGLVTTPCTRVPACSINIGSFQYSCMLMAGTPTRAVVRLSTCRCMVQAAPTDRCSTAGPEPETREQSDLLAPDDCADPTERVAYLLGLDPLLLAPHTGLAGRDVRGSIARLKFALAHPITRATMGYGHAPGHQQITKSVAAKQQPRRLQPVFTVPMPPSPHLQQVRLPTYPACVPLSTPRWYPARGYMPKWTLPVRQALWRTRCLPSSQHGPSEPARLWAARSCVSMHPA